MSFFPRDAPAGGEWGQPARQPSWEQQVPPSRSGATSAAVPEPHAFISQLDEIDKAVDNLVKSGKHHPTSQAFPGAYSGMSNRRESMPGSGRQYSDYDHRSGGSSRNQSVSDFDTGRTGSSAGLQNFYAAQRFQPRQNDQDQMAQAKRRLAAQRERELRNYHQEQQYNRNAPAAKAERPQSPSGMNEDERRELISRQHRALYGNESALYHPEGQASRSSQDARVPMSAHPRGSSPLAYDPFGIQSLGPGSESAVQLSSRDSNAFGLDKKTSTSPTSGRSTFGMVDSVTQASGNSAASPATSPPLGSGSLPPSTSQGGMGAIGSRLAQVPSINTKRAETPNERSASSASNSNGADKTPALSGWGSSSGVWGAPKTPIGVQASAWG